MDVKSKKSLIAAIWYIISNSLSKVLLYVLTPLYTRLLTTAEYGMYSNFVSWQNILVTLLTFDLGSAIAIAYYDYDSENEFNGFVSTICIFSYIIPGFFCILIYLFRGYFTSLFLIDEELLLLLIVYITFSNTLGIFQADQRVRLEYKTSSALTIISSILSVVASLILAIAFRRKITGILLGGTLVNAIISLVLLIYILQRSKKIKYSYLKYAVRVAVPLIPHVLASTILGSSDKVMITRYCGEEQNALYSLAYTISLIITMIASSLNKAWVPWFFDRLKTNTRGSIKKISNIIVGAIGVVSVAVCILAPEIMLLVGGKAYVVGSVVMPPIIISCLINCVSTFYINIEFYNKKTTSISTATVVSAISNIVLNYIFIRNFGYVAAAYTTLFSSILSLIFHIIKVRQQRMWDVFDNSFILGTSLVVGVLCESVLLLYLNSMVRYSIMVVCVLILFILFVKYKNKLESVFQTFVRSRKGI